MFASPHSSLTLSPSRVLPACSSLYHFSLITSFSYFAVFTIRSFRFTIHDMLGRPEPNEAAPYYFNYINRVATDNIVSELESQLNETVALLRSISEEKSLHRYAHGKWSIRQLLNHINDSERVFLFRALWFARGFPDSLPSYDQEISAESARADNFSWANNVEEFRTVRQATLTFFQNLPNEAWLRAGIASDNSFTVRALAYIIAGHVAHHTAILRERYLLASASLTPSA